MSLVHPRLRCTTCDGYVAAAWNENARCRCPEPPRQLDNHVDLYRDVLWQRIWRARQQELIEQRGYA